MTAKHLEYIRSEEQNSKIELAPSQPERLAPLAEHLLSSIAKKIEKIEETGSRIGVHDPDWCRENAEEAGKMHAHVIQTAYGDTYALPNKDPESNRIAIESGDLDVYLMTIDGKLTGTACLVNNHDGTAELGRSASRGETGNSIIQDLRILDWLTNPASAEKYHTLVTTLRSAPDRIITNFGDEDTFIMRGGQAVTEHWRKFPNLTVCGVAPLYKKSGELEQFTCAFLTRESINPFREIYVQEANTIDMIKQWHAEYDAVLPAFVYPAHDGQSKLRFEAHYPPIESGITDLVHADIVASANSEFSLDSAIETISNESSPFLQVSLPIETDTRDLQKKLKEDGFTLFGYRPSLGNLEAVLFYGKVKPGIKVVPTFWNQSKQQNPFWQNESLDVFSNLVEKSW